jgi:putative tricarboxylic transport membrane protein
MKSDRIVAICAVLLAAVYLYATEQIPTLQIGDPMGAKAIPRLLGVILLVSAGLLWLETRLAAKKDSPTPAARAEDEPAGASPAGRHRAVIAAVVVWTAVYFLLFERLGFAIATSLYLLALMAYFNRGRWTANAATAVLFSFGSYLAFTRIFGVQLAPGVLPF